MPYAKADAMAKLIPDELGIDLKTLGRKSQKSKNFMKQILAARVWEYALALEGLNRNAGTHAAGVVISNEPLWKKNSTF